MIDKVMTEMMWIAKIETIYVMVTYLHDNEFFLHHTNPVLLSILNTNPILLSLKFPPSEGPRPVVVLGTEAFQWTVWHLCLTINVPWQT